MGEGNLIDTHKININIKVGAIRATRKLHCFDQIHHGKTGNCDTPLHLINQTFIGRPV